MPFHCNEAGSKVCRQVQSRIGPACLSVHDKCIRGLPGALSHLARWQSQASSINSSSSSSGGRSSQVNWHSVRSTLYDTSGSFITVSITGPFVACLFCLFLCPSLRRLGEFAAVVGHQASASSSSSSISMASTSPTRQTKKCARQGSPVSSGRTEQPSRSIHY